MSDREGDFDRYRTRMEHEDNLIATRINWLVSSQAFLLTPYVLLHNDPPAPFITLLEYVIVTIGLVSSWLTYVSIAAAIHSMMRLTADYGAYAAGRGADTTFFQPNIGLNRPEAMRGLAAPRGFIFLFITVWTFLLMVGLITHELHPVSWPGIALSAAIGLGVALITFCTEHYVTRGMKSLGYNSGRN